MPTPNDPLVRKMAQIMLEGGRSADELREAIDEAVELIESKPEARYADQLGTPTVSFKDEGDVDGIPIGPAAYTTEAGVTVPLSDGEFVTITTAREMAKAVGAEFIAT